MRLLLLLPKLFQLLLLILRIFLLISGFCFSVKLVFTTIAIPEYRLPCPVNAVPSSPLLSSAERPS